MKKIKSYQSASPVFIFGSASPECLGYCSGIFEINEQVKRYVRKANDGSPEQVCVEETPASEWLLLNNTFPTEALFALPERIGCPGCADAPVQWIGMRTDTLTYSVMFETRTLPDELLPIYDVLQDLGVKSCK